MPFLIIDEFGEQGITLPRIEQPRAVQRAGLAFLIIDELGEQSVMRWGLQIVEPLKERSDKSCYLAVALRPRGPIVHRQYVAHRYSGDGSVGVQVGIVFRC